jgi:glycosyltransferase involved in cell wall biosynthesis
MPSISIVMPLYNKEKDVVRALHSVLMQTVHDFELLVVNDGSTDKGPEIVRAIEDNRIRVLDQPNSGVSAARNRGIEEAKSDLITFLDADDEWDKDFLETIMNLRNKFSMCEVFATSYWFSNPEGHRRKAVIRNLPEGPWEGTLTGYFAVAAKSDPPLWTSAVGVTKRAITSVGGFPIGIHSGEDLLTWAKLAANYDIAYANRPCAVHWNPQTVSDRPGRVPQNPDIVGVELVHLMKDTPTPRTEGIKAYIGLWHQMRAVIYVQLGDRKNAFDELKMTSAYFPSLKVSLLMLILKLPFRPPAKLLSVWRRLRRAF